MQRNCVFLIFTFLFAASVYCTPALGLPLAANPSDYYDNGAPAAVKVSLGRALFFDKTLSGNGNISCATCHHPLLDSGDGLSLPVGEGARGLGVTRNTGTGGDAIHERVPRHSPVLFNLGAREFATLFHDGRLAVDATQPTGFLNPAGADLPAGLDNVLAAQAMFPVTSATEMAGQPGENPIADAAAVGDFAGPFGVWAQLAARLREVPLYANGFVTAFDDIDTPADIRFLHAANAIAAFEAVAFRADNSPFDRFLRGERGSMSGQATRGMRLFYGQAGCSGCHSGTFQTDHGFYAIGVPQIGPGKGDGLNMRDDFGRERVTGLVEDRYRFRVPSLRNVALTGPWGHDGAFATLEDVVRHHLNPVVSLNKYRTSDARLPSRPDLDAQDFVVHNDPVSRSAVAEATELGPTPLTDVQVDQLIAFLHALTDPGSVDLREIVPQQVPGGLPVFD